MMTSATATMGHEGTTLKKKKSLKQILIPTKRKSQKSLRNRSSSTAAAGDDDPLRTAVPPDHVRQAPRPSQSIEPQSASSSQAPSSLYSAASSRRPSTSRGLSKQVDKDSFAGTEKLMQKLQTIEQRPGRTRASTLTNFSKPYGILQEQTVVETSNSMRKTSHHTLRKTSVESNITRPHRALTDGLIPATNGQRYPDSRTAGRTTAVQEHWEFGSASQATHPTYPSRFLDEVYHGYDQEQTDARGSSHSVHSLSSTHPESKHSSTFTKISSNTELTMDSDSINESTDCISVNDVIDLYAGLDESETQLSPNTMEINQRSMQIAEAMTAPLGSLPTPGREERSPYTPLISNQRVRNMLHEPPALRNPTPTHDHYGFRKFSRDVSNEDYNQWYQGYSKFQIRRNAKWKTLLSDHGLPTTKPTRFPGPSTKMQRYIRKGIPPAWRGDAWFFYAGGEEFLAAHPDHYVNLVVRSQTDALNRSDREAVERDLHRTFPDNLHFKSETASTSTQIIETPIMTALRRLLCAFAVDHPKIGYCQSLNFIAGLLLLFLPEEKAYWMLHMMTTRILPGTHELSLEGANVDLWVLMLALRQANPGVWAKVGGDIDTNSTRLPPISLCTTSWFMSVFIGTLPMESVLRVWDVLFYEGSKTLFRVALAIFKSGETQIKSVLDPMETFQVVQTLPRKMVDVGSLFEIAFGRGEVGKRWIEKKRAERKAFYAKERVKEKARRESKDAGPRRASTSYGEDLKSPAISDMASPDSTFSKDPNGDYWGRKGSTIKAES